MDAFIRMFKIWKSVPRIKNIELKMRMIAAPTCSSLFLPPFRIAPTCPDNLFITSAIMFAVLLLLLLLMLNYNEHESCCHAWLQTYDSYCCSVT